MQSCSRTPITNKPTRHDAIFYTLDSSIKNRDQEFSPIPTADDETGCATHTDWALKFSRTFLDTKSPVINPFNHKDFQQNPLDACQGQELRELVVPPRPEVRESLVDHMLNSLDQLNPNQFPVGQYNDTRHDRQTTDSQQRGLAYDGLYQSKLKYATWNSRGIGYASSPHNTEAEVTHHECKPLPGSNFPANRSASSSNVKTVAGMILGQRAEAALYSGTQDKISPSPPRKLHSRAGTESKSSSFDQTRHPRSTGDVMRVRNNSIRSSSLDSRGQPRPKLRDGKSSSDFGKDEKNPRTMAHKRQQSSYQIPKEVARSSARPSITNLLSRKRSMRSTEGSNHTEISIETNTNNLNWMRSNGRNDENNRSLDSSSMPTLRTGSHEPGKIRGSPSSTFTIPSIESTPATSTKERPGIFRRVFGSSRNMSWIDNFHEHSPLHGSWTSTETVDRPVFKPLPIHNTPSTRTTPQTLITQEPMPSLTKKPSSFFRRRKKSMSSIAPTDIDSSQTLIQPCATSAPSSVEKTLPSPPISSQAVLHGYPQQTSNNQREFKESWYNNYQGASALIVRSISFPSESVQSSTIRAVDCDDQETIHKLRSRIQIGDPLGNQYATHYRDDIDTERELPQNRIPLSQTLSGISPGNRSTETLDGRCSSEGSPRHLKSSSCVEDENFSWSRSLPLIPRQSMEEPASSIRRTHIARQQSEDWVKITQSRAISSVDREDRVWLEPSSDEEDMGLSCIETLELDARGDRRESDSISSIYESVASLPGELSEWDGEEDYPMQAVEAGPKILSTAIPRIGLVYEDQSTPVNFEEHQYARQIFNGNEDLVPKEKAAAWIGEEDPFRSRVLEAYMDLYDFSNLNILAGLRLLCGRLILKAESQQVDRILVTFSRRWSHCNPFHGFKATDVVHTICYSLLLLNTDLHLAEIEQKMTRSQFIKNAMPTIRKVVTDVAPEAFDSGRPSILPSKNFSFEKELPKQDSNMRKPSQDKEHSTQLNPIKQASRNDTDKICVSPLDHENATEDSGPLVSAQFRGSLRTWEVQVEIVLKNFYNSIRNEPLPLFGSLSGKQTGQSLNSNPLSFFARTPSVVSHTHSDTQSYRSRAADTLRPGNRMRLTKNRSRPGLYPIGSGHGSSRTSLDDQTPMWSPVSSSTWSKYSLGKTQTSVSVDSLGSPWQNGDFNQSIGFANALSQAIIREETTGSPTANVNESEESGTTPLLDDESLELHGAPWAKEGMVKHKHHLESLDKKAKERNWNEVFAVVEKGYLSLFSFSSKSMRQKSKGKAVQGIVGGGNWQANAEKLGSFLLRQTIASALPSPGYSKSRPHVWALSLPTGAVHLFQVGTPDIVKEFVSTTNYWSARMSNHPLVGGISNIEYGWSDAIIKSGIANSTSLDVTSPTQRPTTGSSHRPSFSRRPSIKENSRASIDQALSGDLRIHLPGDKITIADWAAPTQNMRASSLNEKEQLSNLVAYVTGIEEELQKHNKLRSPMLLAFSPRHMNAQKAMANWEKKSAYLLREIVKFRTYIDALQVSESMKHGIYVERENRKKQEN
ncbi:hypothetical protein K3495_g5376 [Podosphaera aphanis]|nr:hypothetical protein K3495_g5376 [Podosphaera aphanis]